MLIAEAITITNPEETTSMRGGFFVLISVWHWNRLSLHPGVVAFKDMVEIWCDDALASHGFFTAFGRLDNAGVGMNVLI